MPAYQSSSPAPRTALRLAGPAALLAALSGCIPARPAPPIPPAARPVPPPAPAPPPPPSSDWRDWPLTPGTWTYARDPRGSVAKFGAKFGSAGTDAALVLRCDRARRQLYVSRPGAALSALTIRTTSATRSLAVQPAGGTPAYVAATLAANDPLLDAIGFSRGRFVVEQQGAATLVVPAWAEIERVTEDCRG